ncbi:MAG: Sec-independent protein translocase protein TatB, partial [Polyangiaceae bacterium]
MFGISFTEILVIALVALVFVGPQKLPKMLRTVGEWIAKVRSLTSQVRQQTGIDEILKQEGIDGGLSELRNIMRGDLSSVGRSRSRTS